MKIFITGIAGFIGFHLAKKLRSLNYIVSGIDNFNDYYDVNLKRHRANELRKLNTKIIEQDLTDFNGLEKSIRDANPTHIVHLAAQAGVRYSITNPHAYISSNILGFTNILEALKNNPEIPIIYASSSSVYGNTPFVPFKESQRTDSPINLYGATKKANELMAHSYHHLYNLKLIGLRFFTVYGPWGRPDMAYFSFANAMKEKKPITIYEEVTIKRDFTYIDDIIDGVIKTLSYPPSLDIFNLGNNHPILLTEFIEILEEALGIEAIKEYLPKPPADMGVTYADITKSRELLGFEPKTSLKEGLKEFARWHHRYYPLSPLELHSQ